MLKECRPRARPSASGISRTTLPAVSSNREASETSCNLGCDERYIPACAPVEQCCRAVANVEPACS